jgi:hypothetical protein
VHIAFLTNETEIYVASRYRISPTILYFGFVSKNKRYRSRSAVDGKYVFISSLLTKIHGIQHAKHNGQGKLKFKQNGEETNISFKTQLE